ncbi:MAG: DUF3098 domain-containing protein [Bacteroidales bacterium]|nr:DUF3098 domain-containing protein [Bacteroidales bacterium]
MNTQDTKNNPQFRFAFTKTNYIWMAVGVAMMIIGYILLIGGGSNDADVFNYALFNTRRLVVAPVLILAGLVTEVYAIMKKTDNNANKSK